VACQNCRYLAWVSAATQLTMVYHVCNTSCGHLVIIISKVSRQSISCSAQTYRHSEPSPSKMLYTLAEMHVIAFMRLLLWSPHRHRRFMVGELSNAIGNSLARCPLQWCSRGRWRNRLLWREIAIPRLLAEQASQWRRIRRVWKEVSVLGLKLSPVCMRGTCVHTVIIGSEWIGHDECGVCLGVSGPSD